MEFELIIENHLLKEIQANNFTKEDIEKRMYEVFSYIPQDYDFVDTTINKNGKSYRIMFGVCEITENKITVECLHFSDPEKKLTGPTLKEYALKKAKC